MAKPLRIFISSPGDVVPERRRAQLVIDKLAKTYARFFAIEPILWEVEPMLASGHFQDQIVPPSEADIVVLIVWSRLGTPLPERTETREYHGIDGRVPVTGTEWEFEDALAAQKKSGAPDLLAYRKEADPTVSIKDDAKLDAAKDQWRKLNVFWRRWFEDRGQFRAAFNTFVDLDGFEERLENDLRKLIEHRIEIQRTTEQGGQAPIWQESPFRGLDSYRFEHAPIFFGRSAMTKAAVEQLTGNAEDGRAFLLILGASGSGKSSLAQAGVLPALVARGIVPGVGLWRRAVMRPSGNPDGPFAALAQAITAETALPELLAPKQDVAEVALLFKTSPDGANFSIKAVLNRIEENARTRGDVLKAETARLVLLVDQLEELFTASDFGVDDRKAFIRCLDGLARSGRVYVLATMRSDLWHRSAETPQLVDMAAGNGRLDLLPPVQDEIMEMIRQPAQATGIEYETDPVRDIKLDATLAAEAANEPGALPLLSFLLDELYKKDITAGGSTLTYASMKELGGLKGAIANRANTAFEAVSATAQAAMPKVLWELVTVSGADAEPIAQVASMARFREGSPEREIVDELLDPQVRLLVAEGDGEGARVRLAHEALITHWERAKRLIAQQREDYRTRAIVRVAQIEWRKADTGKQRSYLLRDPQLANAIDLANRRSDAFDTNTLAFIAESRRAATRRRNIVTAGLAAGLAVALGLAGLAYWQRGIAVEQRVLAQKSQEKANDERDRALITQSRFLADLANQRARDGDSGAAMALALEALPDESKGVSRPYVAEAEYALIVSRQQLREFQILWGHTFRVTHAAFSSDGKLLVSASQDKTARVWDVASATQIMLLDGHENAVSSAAFSFDGRKVVTASFDETARVWDVATGKELLVLRGHEHVVFRAEFSPDGKWIVTASGDNTARLWDVESGKQILVFRHEKSVRSASFSPDSKHVITASSDETVRIWDAISGAQILLRKQSGVLTSAVFSPDGQRVLVACDKSAYLWDAKTGKEIVALNGHGDLVLSVAFSPDGKRAVTAAGDFRQSGVGADSTARVWDLESGKELAVLRGHAETVWSAAFSPDGKTVVTASSDETIRLWNVENDISALTFDEQNEVKSAEFSPRGDLVVTTSYKTARIWDVASGKEIMVLRGHSSWVNFAAFSSDGRRIVTASEDKTARVWDVATGKELMVLIGHQLTVWTAVFSPDDQRIVTASSDKTARLWDAASGAEILLLSGHEKIVRSAAFSPDGKRVVTASDDETARIWDLATAKVVVKLDGHNFWVTGASFSPDGKSVLTTSVDTNIKIWDAATGKRQLTLRGDSYEDAVLAAAFSPDGHRIVAAYMNHTVKVWDAITGQKIVVLRGHGDAVRSAVFSPDGQQVLTASDDKTARLWPLFINRTDLINGSKRTVPRCLTRMEREQAFLDPAPPAWCIEMEKWPYYTQVWKDWLKASRSNAIVPLPDWEPWRSRQAGSEQSKLNQK